MSVAPHGLALAVVASCDGPLWHFPQARIGAVPEPLEALLHVPAASYWLEARTAGAILRGVTPYEFEATLHASHVAPSQSPTYAHMAQCNLGRTVTSGVGAVVFTLNRT